MSKVAKPGKTKDHAVLPSGTLFKPLGEHFLAAIIPLPKASQVIHVSNDGAAFPLGRQSNKPIQWGKVLAVGDKVHTLKPGDVVLLHPLNLNPRVVEDVEYYLPREAAAYCVVDDS